MALAAHALGIGPGRTGGAVFWHPAAFKTRGGVVGQGELWVASHLLSTLGAQILAVFLFVAGLILVTGATVAGVVRATGSTVAGTSRALKRSTEDRVVRRPATAAAAIGRRRGQRGAPGAAAAA